MKHILVVGSGIVGVCCALALRRDGHEVTLVDRNEPGSQCSFGNAGTLCGNAHFPLAGMLPKIPAMLLKPTEPLSIVWRDLAQLVPWFWRYLKESRPSRTHAIAQAAASLNERVHGEMTAMLRAAGLMQHLHWTGRLFAYRSNRALDAERHLMALKFEAGVQMRELSGDEARDMEPALGPLVACAIYTPDAGHIVNPLRLTQELLRTYLQLGGKFVQADVTGFRQSGPQPTSAETSAGRIEADMFLVASGAWSGALGRSVGTRLNLVAERGYHAMIAQPGVQLKIPTMWVDRKIAITQMEHGLRIAGVSEFGMPDSPPDYAKIPAMLKAAHELLPGLQVREYAEWMGPRPATPDYLPVIGRSPRFANVLFACGHGHSGLMFAPVTARLVADLAAGRPAAIDLSPFDPGRFL